MLIFDAYSQIWHSTSPVMRVPEDEDVDIVRDHGIETAVGLNPREDDPGARAGSAPPVCALGRRLDEKLDRVKLDVAVGVVRRDCDGDRAEHQGVPARSVVNGPVDLGGRTCHVGDVKLEVEEAAGEHELDVAAKRAGGGICFVCVCVDDGHEVR